MLLLVRQTERENYNAMKGQHLPSRHPEHNSYPSNPSDGACARQLKLGPPTPNGFNSPPAKGLL